MKQLFLVTSTLMFMQAHAQQSNYHFAHTDSTTAPSAKIWRLWTDVPNWKQWDKGLKEATLNGPFTLGAKGSLIPDKGPKSAFIISKLVSNQAYTFKTKVPFGWLIVARRLKISGSKTYFTHEVEFTGLLKKFLGNKLGKKYRAMLPEVLSEIKKLAEQQ